MDDITVPETLRRLDLRITLDPAYVDDDGCGGVEARRCPSAQPSSKSPSLREATGAQWMSRIDDRVPLSSLSIPGTHDSCARSIVPYVRTQNLKVSHQLDLGVRALDLRLRLNSRDGQLYCFHGGVPLGPGLRSLPLTDVMADVWDFLERTGRMETVLISVDNDDIAGGRDPDGRSEFHSAVARFVAETPPWPGASEDDPPTPRWFAEPRTPRLGEVRGRVILMRRFRAPEPTDGNEGGDGDDKPVDDPPPVAALGIDLSAWVNNSADFTIVTPHARFRVQDRWDYMGRVALRDLLASKSECVRSMLDLAATERARPGEEACTHWFINFCSAVGDPYSYGEVAEPRSVAVGTYTDWGRTWVDGINVLTGDYLREQRQQGSSRWGLGIVYMDYPELPEDNNLVSLLIDTNF